MEPCDLVFRDFLEIHDPECLETVRRSSCVRRYRKGELVLRAGEIQTEMPFLLSGSFWCYYTGSQGRRHMECLCDRRGFPMTPGQELAAFGKPSEVNLETLELTEALCVPMKVIVYILEHYPEVMDAMGRLVAMSLQWHRQYLLWNSCTVAERYERFCEMYPELSQRLTRTAIAAILNTNLPALSRALKSPT